MKSNSTPRIAIGIIIAVLALLFTGACGRNQNQNAEMYAQIEELENHNADLEAAISQLESTIALLEATVTSYREVRQAGEMKVQFQQAECNDNCVILELPELWAQMSGVQSFTKASTVFEADHDVRTQIRVFERGNANIRLFPDGTFVANLWHNTKVTGTYRELTQGHETAVLFTHSGKTLLSGGESTFYETGTVTVVGGIVDDILTMPEDWDDGHGHGMEFDFIAYPLVFVGDYDQSIVLNADNTFVANFVGDITVIGFYGMRAASVTFSPGSPTFSSGGLPVGSFLHARFLTCADEIVNDYAFEELCNIPDENNQEDEQSQDDDTSTEEGQAQSVADGAGAAGQNQQQNADDSPNQTQEPANQDDSNDNQRNDDNGTPDPDPPEEPDDNNDTTPDTPPDSHDLEWCDECQDYH